MSKLFTVVTHDKPEALPIRMEHLNAHLAHIEANLDQLAIAGPHRNAAGEFLGAMMVVKAETAEEAEAFVAQDPYFKAGVWAKIDIYPFSAAAGYWIGGKAW